MLILNRKYYPGVSVLTEVFRCDGRETNKLLQCPLAIKIVP